MTHPAVLASNVANLHPWPMTWLASTMLILTSCPQVLTNSGHDWSLLSRNGVYCPLYYASETRRASTSKAMSKECSSPLTWLDSRVCSTMTLMSIHESRTVGGIVSVTGTEIQQLGDSLLITHLGNLLFAHAGDITIFFAFTTASVPGGEIVGHESVNASRHDHHGKWDSMTFDITWSVCTGVQLFKAISLGQSYDNESDLLRRGPLSLQHCRLSVASLRLLLFFHIVVDL